MSYIVNIIVYISLGIFLLFLLSLIGFFFYRRRQLDKVKILNYITNENRTFSTYNIHKNLFRDKKLTYVNYLLEDLQRENIIERIEMGSSKENGLWEKI